MSLFLFALSRSCFFPLSLFRSFSLSLSHFPLPSATHPLSLLQSEETDARGQYADALLRLFLSEGLCVGHDTLLASADMEPEALLRVRFQQECYLVSCLR